MDGYLCIGNSGYIQVISIGVPCGGDYKYNILHDLTLEGKWVDILEYLYNNCGCDKYTNLY